MRVGYPIKIMFKNEDFFTLYFDEDDELLIKNNEIVCYKSEKELYDVECLNYKIDESLCVYDFNRNIYQNPIDYNEVLDKWNLLNTIAKGFKMYFEGDQKNKTFTYNFLFKCVFSEEALPKYYKLPKKCILNINKVFKKSERYLRKLIIKER